MNNLILEEINRFKEILNYKNLLSESIIGGTYDNIIRTLIKQKIDDIIKNATRESLESLTKKGGNFGDNLFALKSADGKPFDMNKIYNDVKTSLKNTKGVILSSADTDFTIRQQITKLIDKEKDLFIKKAKNKLQFDAPNAKKAAPSAGGLTTKGNRSAADAASGQGLPASGKKPGPSGQGLPASGKKPGPSVSDRRKIQKPKLKQADDALVQSQANQIKNKLKDDVAELAQAVADPSKLAKPTMKQKLVDFVKKAKLVNANGKISAIGIGALVLLGLGTFGVIGALGESGITPEGDIVPENSAVIYDAGSGWRSMGSTYDSQIKTAAGLDASTPLSDADIDVIYNKLKENGTIK